MQDHDPVGGNIKDYAVDGVLKRDKSGYHRQGTVENAFFRYKSIIGGRLRARHSKAQEAETLIACNILNGMTALGRPASYAIDA